MSNASLSSFQFELKQYYIMNDPVNLTYQAGPAWALLNKETSAGGKNMPVPQIYANSNGGSKTFSNAQTNKSSVQGAQFLISSYSKYYDVGTIDEDLISASREDRFAWVKAMTMQIDSSLRSHGQFLAMYTYLDGSGAMAQVSNVSSNTVTLQDPGNVNRFSVGMSVVSASAKFSGTAPTNTQLVTAVNEDAGTVTFNTLPASTTNNWYLFRDGDYVTNGIGSLLVGLAGWLPTVAPTTGDSFFTVDRSVDVAKLSGVRLDATGMAITDVLIKLAQKIFTNGGRPTKSFMHPVLMGLLLQDLQNKSIYTPGRDMMEGTDISFEKISLRTSFGTVDIYSDIWMDTDKIYMLDWDKWYFANMNLATMFTSDGMELLRTYDEDSVEYRIRTYGQLACRGVGFNGVAYNLTA